jgi:glycosyltransferase involved in cell wall biosynthesis
MNITIFSWRGPGHPNAGGAEIVTHEHARAWIREGHNVTLFTSFFTGAKRNEIVDGVKIIRDGNDFFGVKLSAFKWYLSLKEKPDLVVDEFHGIPFFTPLYVRKAKLAFIHEVAREVWFMNPVKFPLNIIYGVIGFLGEPVIFSLLYRQIPFMTVSESTKDDLIKYGIPGKNVTVIHNGVEPFGNYPVKPKEKTKTALYLGALSKDKGVRDAIEAFALISQKQPDWEFWIVGKGDKGMADSLVSQSRRLGIFNKVKFWGFVSDPKKFELLARSHVLVNPSIREGWGLVNIEANICGTPVVGYNVPGVRDSVVDGSTGLLSQPGDYGSLAKNVLKLTQNPNLYIKFQRNCINWSRKFEWKDSTQKSLRLIERVTK